MSILTGVGSLVDDWLRTAPKGQPPYYRHRSAANELTFRNTPITGTREFLDSVYQQISSNWLSRESARSHPSRENWRWKRHLELSPNNRSPELQLERSIVRNCGDNWSNQMPVASGLVGPATDKRAAVDLVYRHNSTRYAFIELKVDSDNALFAAIEILIYGLIFTWSKVHQEQLGYELEAQPVLKATDVTLIVLAPASYYSTFDMTGLCTALNSGIADFGKTKGLSLAFEFSRLGAGYTINANSDAVRRAVENRQHV